MARVAWFFLLFVLWSMVTAPVAAHADLPDPQKWTIPMFIDVVGRGPDGAPDARGTFFIVARDVANNPIAGLTVIVDFMGCPDIRIDQQQWPSLTVDCAAKSVSAVTDVNGVATFCIVGFATNPGGAPGAGLGGVHVSAAGFLMSTMTATVTDENGGVTTPGLELTDLSAWLADFGTGVYLGRSDFDQNGVLNVADLVILLRAWGAGTSVLGPNAICP